LPQWNYTDGQGTAWLVVSNASASPPMIFFVPASYQDLLSYTVDFRALLFGASGERRRPL
jgi:hypothetical protein